MTYSSWEDIYEKKTSNELYVIFRGHNNSTFEQKKLAKKILDKRSFDFNNIDEYKKKWELEKKKEARKIEEKHPILYYLISRRGYIVSLISGAFLLLGIFIISEYNLKEDNKSDVLFLIIYFSPFIVSLIFGIYYQKNKIKNGA